MRCVSEPWRATRLHSSPPDPMPDSQKAGNVEPRHTGNATCTGSPVALSRLTLQVINPRVTIGLTFQAQRGMKTVVNRDRPCESLTCSRSVCPSPLGSSSVSKLSRSALVNCAVTYKAGGEEADITDEYNTTHSRYVDICGLRRGAAHEDTRKRALTHERQEKALP